MRRLILLLAVFPALLSAQSSPDSLSPGVPRLTLKVNAGALIYPAKQAYAFAANVRIAPQWSIQVGAGAIFASSAFAGLKGESYKGLRLRGGIQYYFYTPKNSAYYLALEGKHHDIRHLSLRHVWRQGQQYVQFMPIERKVRTYAVDWCVGAQTYHGRKKRFLIEPYAGFGIAYHRVRLLLPPDGEPFEEFGEGLFEYPEGNSRWLDLMLGVHVGVALW